MTPEIAAPAIPLTYDVKRLRDDFPILARTINGKPLAYLDNAATTQKPQVVLDAIASYYTNINANVHRGVHELSARATDAYEAGRERVRQYFNAGSVREIVFTRNATEGINLVAFTFARARLTPGDEVLISAMEHHSNIVPWQLVCEATGAHLKVAPIDDRGELILEEFDRLLTPRSSGWRTPRASRC
jgi:cysteine desulfurase/selenocysteine lyase